MGSRRLSSLREKWLVWITSVWRCQHFRVDPRPLESSSSNSIRNRRAEFDASERRIGITKEVWYLAKLPTGDHVIGHMEAQDFNQAFQSFVASRDSFDLWFKLQMLALTGLDLNNPPADMTPPELLSCYELTFDAGGLAFC